MFGNIIRKTLIHLSTCLCHTVTQNLKVVKFIFIFHLFIYLSIQKILLSTYYILGSGLGALDVVMNRKKSLPS